MSKKLYGEMTAGTMADSSTSADVKSSSQTIAKPNVISSVCFCNSPSSDKYFPCCTKEHYRVMILEQTDL